MKGPYVDRFDRRFPLSSLHRRRAGVAPMTLQAHQLGCERGERTLFSRLNFTLEPGDAMRVAGANGCGKTSLLRMLCGLTPPAEGEVRWHGRDIRSVRDDYCRQLLYLGHANGVKDDLLAWENVAHAAALAGAPLTRAHALQALERLGLGRAASLPTRALSQGQRKRVALARLQHAEAPLWILDEPFTALDQDALTQLCATLDAHLARGGMLLYTTHQEVALQARRALRVELGRARPC